MPGGAHLCPLGSIFSNRCDNTVTTSAIAVMLTKKEIVALLKKELVALHNVPVVKYDAPVVKIFQLLLQEDNMHVCSSRYYPEHPKIIL